MTDRDREKNKHKTTTTNHQEQKQQQQQQQQQKPTPPPSSRLNLSISIDPKVLSSQHLIKTPDGRQGGRVIDQLSSLIGRFTAPHGRNLPPSPPYPPHLRPVVDNGASSLAGNQARVAGGGGVLVWGGNTNPPGTRCLLSLSHTEQSLTFLSFAPG